ncbi:WYL domain-containing protein [Crossiella equi]|uniref:WYL domain-containing protein n=1 Tax=Crossiella equi TaxID=130796 RepID=UPI0035570941
MDPPGWFRRADHTPNLTALAAGVWERRRIAIRHRRRLETELVRRELEPLGVVLESGLWYLVARPGGGAHGRTARRARVGACGDTGGAGRRGARRPAQARC